MRRVKGIIAVGALALSFAFGTGDALAFTNGGGNSGSAPGQANAIANCFDNIAKQTDKGVSAGGGPKEGVPAPTNCDHFFNP